MAFNPFSFLKCGIEVVCKWMSVTFLVLYALGVLFTMIFVMSAEASCLTYGYFEYMKSGLNCRVLQQIDTMNLTRIGPMRFFNMESNYAFRYSMILWFLCCMAMAGAHGACLIGNIQTDKRLVLAHPAGVASCFVIALVVSTAFLIVGNDGFFPFWLLIHLPFELVTVTASVALFLQLRENEEESDADDDELAARSLERV